MQCSKFTFEVRVKNAPLKEYEHGADTYVEGRKGTEYELYFYNKTHRKVEVVFSVDGLDVIEGKTASDKSTGYIVGPYSYVTIPGWKINSNKAAAFQFRPQDAKANTTYVEILKSEGFDVDTSNQGVIGCMVFEERYIPPVTPVVRYLHTNAYVYPQPQFGNFPMWSSDRPITTMGGVGLSQSSQQMYCSSAVPAQNMGALRNSTGFVGNEVKTSGRTIITYASDMDATASLGTGFGADVKFDTVKVKFERDSNPVWIAVLNYDTIQGLRKRGIFIQNSTPKAFPGFQETGCYVPKNR